MENKKVKFPAATIFIILDVLLSVITVAISRSMGMIVSKNVLVWIVRLFLCCLLFRKKQDKILFYGTCALSVVCLISLLRSFNIWTFLYLLNSLLIVFVVGTTALPELSGFKGIAEKLYFVPSVIYLISPIRNIILMFFKDGYYDIIFYNLLVCLDSLLWAVAVLLFIKWSLNPYAKEKAICSSEAAAVNSDYGYNVSKTVLDYNEAYCGLVKHILLSLFTFGIWMYIWIYRTTRTLNKAKNTEKYDPTKKLLLCMFVPFYLIFWFYKHGEKLDELNAAEGKRTDNKTAYLLLGLFIPIVGCMLMQENINMLCIPCVLPVNKSEASADTAADNEKNTAEALREYSSLLESGVITQEEFDQKKKQLLNL